MRRPAQDLLGYRVYAHGTAACVAAIAEWIAYGDRLRWLACLNPHSWVVAHERPDFAAALHSADWLVPDGAGVTLASHLLDAGVGSRVTGSDVFEGVSRTLNSRGGARIFFLGGDEPELALIRKRHERDYPNLRVVGTFAPPFRREFSREELDEMVKAIHAARPDVLWVGLGAPKQELWLHRLSGRLPVRFAAAIGAVFDFYAGRVKRSHPAIGRMGLEWLPRLLRDPRRLWRRTFVSAPVFLWHVGKMRLGGTGGGRAP